LIRIHNLVVGATGVSNSSKIGADPVAAAQHHEVRRKDMIDGREDADGREASQSLSYGTGYVSRAVVSSTR
jgi:hypothetical protein